MADFNSNSGQPDNTKISKMLLSPDKGMSQIKGIKGILTALFRKILADRQITMFNWGSLMIDYLHDPRNKVPDNNRDRTSARGNLNKEFTNTKMSWGVFLKALRFIQAERIEFQVSIKWPGIQNRTSHSVDVVFYQQPVENNDNEEVEEDVE